MRKIFTSLVLFAIAMTTCNAQYNNQNTKHGAEVYAHRDSSEILLLKGCYTPNAVLTSNNEIICTGIGLYTEFPAIATKIDSAGNLLWDTVWLGTPQESGDINGDAKMLPRSDGGAYFVFEYYEFKSRQDHTVFYAKYPHIQYVDSSGNIKWGETGIRLTNMDVDFHGGADLKHISYSADGNIIVYWSWFNDHGSSGQDQEFGTYVQKIDLENGSLLLGDSSKKLSDFQMSQIIESLNGNIYMFPSSVTGIDSVSCFNSMAEKRWQLSLFSDLNISQSPLVGTNDSGELIIIYGTGQDIRAALYNEYGSQIWTDILISTTYTRINNLEISVWNSDSWVFHLGSDLYIIDRNGHLDWGESGKNVSIGIRSAIPVDEKSLFVVSDVLADTNSYIRDLYIKKLDRNGEFDWNDKGIKVTENISGYCTVLPDKNGGAYLIYHAHEIDEPKTRPRGIYMQKVDKDGNLGIINNIKADINAELISSKSFYLHQNYPNPFNPQTTIIYSLWHKEHVVLRVYDILGRQVAVLVNEVREKGEYSVEFNGAELSGGMYIVNLQAGEFNKTIKVLLIK